MDDSRQDNDSAAEAFVEASKKTIHDVGSHLHLVNHQAKLKRRRETLQSYRAKADAKRSWPAKFADFTTSKLGSVTFLTLNAIWFASWVLINTGTLPIFEPFDTFPFGLLTMIVSLEAIFLAIIVLISQNRAAYIDDVREEVDLYINSMTENEVSKVIELLVILMEKSGIDVTKDPELAKMLTPLKSEDVERALEEELS